MPLVVSNVAGEEGKFSAPIDLLDPGARKFSLEYLVPFGTATTVYLPVGTRDEGKSPSQKRSARGAVIGYCTDMGAYKVWDLEKKKIRQVSFSFAFIHEGFYPFKNKVARRPKNGAHNIFPD